MAARLKNIRTPQRAHRRAKRQRRLTRAHARMWESFDCEWRQDHQLSPADRNPPVVRLPRSFLDEVFGVTR